MRTLETEHFRVHYPVEATDFAEHAAQHLEWSRVQTQKAVGRTEDRVIEVYIDDPYATANGMAYSNRLVPRMVLWATPPTSTDDLSYHRDFLEILVLHEDLHLVHLLTPPRSVSGKRLWNLFGVGPLGVPRWVSEGYATLVEGQVTGVGRPHGDLRAAMIRVLAQEGRLPAYDELDASERWRSGGDAYLIGSAYLEWLLDRTDPEALQRLWRRDSAVTNRSFDKAFTGVFGAPPEELYNRFRAEITVRALELEREGGPHEEVLRLEGSTRGPAVSPDGTKVALVVASKDPDRSHVRVYSTVPDEEAMTKAKEKRAEQLKEDPLDVESVLPVRPVYKQLHAYPASDLRPPNAPRWVSDKTVLLEARIKSKRRYLSDLLLWNVEEGTDQRVTHGANVRAADPAPDGTWAVAVQTDWGATRLVKVDLRADTLGTIEPLTVFSQSVVCDAPRVSPDGKRIVFMEQSEGKTFRPVLMELESGGRTELPATTDVSLTSPAWRDDDTLVFGASRDGAYEIVEHDLGTPRWTTLTNTNGRAQTPEPAAEALFFLELHPDGFNLDKTTWDGVKDPILEGLSPVVSPPARTDVASLLEHGPVPTSTRYGAGRVELFPLVGGGFSTDGLGQLELGFRFGDAVGRHEGLVLGSLGARGANGATGAGVQWAWHTPPVDLLVHSSALSRGGVDAASGVLAEVSRTRGTHQLRANVGPHIRVRDGKVVPGGTGMASFRLLDKKSWIRLGATGRLEGSATGGLVRAEFLSSLRLGRDFSLGGSWRRGSAKEEAGYVLGGLQSGVMHESMQWRFAGGPQWGPQRGPTGSTRLDDWRVELGDSTKLFFQNVRVRSPSILAEGTMVGLSSQAASGAMPLLRIPSVSFDSGLGCQVKVPGFARDRRPCQELSDYVAWGSLRFAL